MFTCVAGAPLHLPIRGYKSVANGLQVWYLFGTKDVYGIISFLGIKMFPPFQWDKSNLLVSNIENRVIPPHKRFDEELVDAQTLHDAACPLFVAS